MTAPVKDTLDPATPSPNLSNAIDGLRYNEAPAPTVTPLVQRLKTLSAETLRARLDTDSFDAVKRSFRSFVRLLAVRRRPVFALGHPAEYRLARRGYDIVFLIDSPGFWPHIGPVVDEVRRRRPDFRLAVTFEGPRSTLPQMHIPFGIEIIANVAEYTAWALKTKVLYTPRVNKNEFLSAFHRPRGAKVVCAPFSLNTLDGTFPEDYFDGYDYVICQGPDHIASFRRLGQRRPAMAGKKLIPAGYPKLDLMLASRKGGGQERPSGKTVIVYAPTHAYSVNEKLASLRRYGEAIVGALLREGYKVIFRPHHVSYQSRDERPVIDRIRQRHGENQDFTVDSRALYFESYTLADLMVTDLSGVGFMFAFGFEKPTVFFAPDADAEKGLSGIQFEDRHRIGAVARSVDDMLQSISDLSRRDMAAEIAQFRQEAIFNVGASASSIAEFLDDLVSGRERPDTIQL
jgi:CDP-Glycerol:Poly(glycerophosphate) glycerophosphotransferase